MTSQELKQARAVLGITQAELAQKLHLSTNTVARYEMPSNHGRYQIPHWVSNTLRLWLATGHAD